MLRGSHNREVRAPANARDSARGCGAMPSWGQPSCCRSWSCSCSGSAAVAQSAAGAGDVGVVCTLVAVDLDLVPGAPWPNDRQPKDSQLVVDHAVSPWRYQSTPVLAIGVLDGADAVRQHVTKVVGGREEHEQAAVRSRLRLIALLRKGLDVHRIDGAARGVGLELRGQSCGHVSRSEDG